LGRNPTKRIEKKELRWDSSDSRVGETAFLVSVLPAKKSKKRSKKKRHQQTPMKEGTSQGEEEQAGILSYVRNFFKNTKERRSC